MEQKDLFNSELGTQNSEPQSVECLGMTFENDDARRACFLDKLRERLSDLEFRKIEGFSIGSDEDILTLSDPPYYTACPNPFIADFIKHYCKQYDPSEPYSREPFAADVSEGKNDPIYNAHSYHTKVPHKAIMRYILHYTEPGYVVFDGFCGTGMTGAAAQMCGDKATIESLGYKVEKDGTISQQETDENDKNIWKPFSILGARRAILNDLSPAATFIAYNYNTPVDVNAFELEAKRILKEVQDEFGWMYETLHVEPASSRLLSSIEFEHCDPFEATHSVYRRDNLPHIQVPEATYFITFRTHSFRKLTEQGRKIVLDAILHWDDQRWKVFSAVVMPDHVHIVARPLPKGEKDFWDLAVILHSVKSFSANEVNRVEDKPGTPVWQTESYDRIVRDINELLATLAYIHHNSVKAGLVTQARDYSFRYVAGEIEKAGWKPAPLGKINYTVWSDVFVCPECTSEVIFWEAAVDKAAGSLRDEFPCPHCGAMLTKRKMDRAWVTKFDKVINQTIRQAKQFPVLINYTVNGKRAEKTPDQGDLALIAKTENRDVPYWFPTTAIPKGDKTGEPLRIGITHVHHFYTKRNLWILSALRNRAMKCGLPSLHYWLNSLEHGLGKRVKYGDWSFPMSVLSGTLYIPALSCENSPLYFYDTKYKKQSKVLRETKANNNPISTCSSEVVALNDSQIDYIFIDPPFGAILNYSELSFLWESWMKRWTNNKSEAIENKTQGKGPNEYRHLMTACFREAYRVLKPGRWMTVEFSNTKASVWNSIQTALSDAGFIVANVSALDKQQGSFNAVTNTTSVKQDLVISAYKPYGGFEERFQNEAQTEEGVWDFVRTHLKYLPVIKRGAGATQLIAVTERDPRILYDQMVAYFVRKGFPVPLNNSAFQEGLSQRFSYRDGMYYLPEQVVEYDKKRLSSGGLEQASLFVTDESSAIAWLRQLLKDKPQTFQELHPQFLKELGGWQKHEKPLELSDMLEQNFLRYDGNGEVPNQIHSYLSSNFKELRNLPKDDESLRAKGKDRWYIPDPNKAGDLEKLRERSLLKEFEGYRTLGVSGRSSKLKVFRLEAVRAGFKKAWQERDYAMIITVARKIPENVLQEDPKLLMWYDQAVTRKGGE